MKELTLKQSRMLCVWAHSELHDRDVGNLLITQVKIPGPIGNIATNVRDRLDPQLSFDAIIRELCAYGLARCSAEDVVHDRGYPRMRGKYGARTQRLARLSTWRTEQAVELLRRVDRWEVTIGVAVKILVLEGALHVMEGGLSP